MKNRISVLPLLAATFLSIALLHAEPANLSSQIDGIRLLLKPSESDTPEVKAAKARLQSLPASWQSLLDTDQLASFSQYGTRNLGTELSAVPELEAKVDAFMKSVKQESDRRDAAKISEAEAILAQTGELLKNAKKPEDLDALMLNLSKSKLSEYGNNPKLSAVSRDLQGALQIVGNWQEYLMAKEAGKAEESRSNLQQISSQLASTPNENHATDQRIPLDQIIAKLTESGDSAAAMEELKTVPKSSLTGSDYTSFLRNLQLIEDLRKLEPVMSESEVFANIRITSQTFQSQVRYSMARAIDQIALNSIARSYGIETPSSKTNSARKLLESIATTAHAKQDWPKLRQSIISLENLGTGTYSQDSRKTINDLKIISLLELGKEAEQRNDFEAAASAYLEASSIDGLYLQREVGYAKLADLKQKYPDKVSPVLAKAEENRQRAEAARYAADIESRDRMNMNRMMPFEPQRQRELMRPLIQEVVAEFLKEKRLETAKPAGSEDKPKETPKKE
jgi:hypothetical protein